MLNVLMAHNYYQQPGGEDRSFAAEADVLERHGNTVHRYTVHNDVINEMSRLKVARATIWNSETYQHFKGLFRQQRFDIAHFQNTFPLISPAAYYAAQDSDVPVVQSLRNYRLICSNALFFRDGHVCEDCMNKFIPWPALVHSCYRDSRTQTAGVAALLVVHRLRQTWQKQVDTFICLSEFARDKFVEAGIDPQKMVVKPNFLQEDPGVGPGNGGYMLLVARMTREKGVWTVLEAWRKLKSDVPLKIAGDGPELPAMREFVAQQQQNNQLNSVEILGRLKPAETLETMKGARALVFPSEWYETFGRVAIESYAVGVPVIASDIGAISELVDEGETGLLFPPGDAETLAARVDTMWSDAAKAAQMGKNARQAYEERYTAERNYDLMLQIYEDVRANYRR